MGLNVWLSYFKDGNSPGLLLGELQPLRQSIDLWANRSHLVKYPEEYWRNGHRNGRNVST